MDDPASVAVRFALYVDLMLLLGLPAFGLYALRGAERASGAVLAFRRWIGALALIGVALSALALMLLAASMSGTALADVDRASVDAVVTGTSIGTAWQVRIASLLAAGLCGGPVDSGVADLSGREIEVLRLVSDGQSNKQIGEELGLSALTVKSHLARIARKLGTGDRAEIVAMAMRGGVIR